MAKRSGGSAWRKLTPGAHSQRGANCRGQVPSPTREPSHRRRRRLILPGTQPRYLAATVPVPPAVSVPLGSGTCCLRCPCCQTTDLLPAVSVLRGFETCCVQCLSSGTCRQTRGPAALGVDAVRLWDLLPSASVLQDHRPAACSVHAAGLWDPLPACLPATTRVLHSAAASQHCLRSGSAGLQSRLVFMAATECLPNCSCSRTSAWHRSTWWAE